MFTWNVEEMKLMNETFKYFIGNERIYDDEYNVNVSREDKIAFVDSMQDGKLSYILSIIDKFNKEKDTLPKDNYGYVKTVSLRAWLKRNDTGYDRPVFDNWYHYGHYSLLGSERSLNTLYSTKGGYDFYDDFVDECFHRQLKECERLERKYFKEHDEYSILKTKLIKNIDKFNTTFDVNIKWSSDGNIYIYEKYEVNESTKSRDKKITIEELKELIDKYNKLEDYIKELSKEINIVY